MSFLFSFFFFLFVPSKITINATYRIFNRKHTITLISCIREYRNKPSCIDELQTRGRKTEKLVLKILFSLSVNISVKSLIDYSGFNEHFNYVLIC